MSDGFAQIRKGLKEHIKAGRITPYDAGVYLFLQLFCDWSKGIYHGCALKIAFDFGDSSHKDQIKESLMRLKKIKFINYRKGDGRRGNYDILIDKYDIQGGFLKGQRLNAWEHGNKVEPSYEDTPEEFLTDSRQSPEDPRKTSAASPDLSPIKEVKKGKREEVKDANTLQATRSSQSSSTPSTEKTKCPGCDGSGWADFGVGCSVCAAGKAATTSMKETYKPKLSPVPTKCPTGTAANGWYCRCPGKPHQGKPPAASLPTTATQETDENGYPLSF